MRPSSRERLAELEELKGRGLLTAEEYAAKRKEILESL
jgi:cytochrome c-type biogenesis protein CcmH/NrfG